MKNRKSLRKGLLISFEGIEGSGKSTQARKLVQYLQKKGFPALLVREPGGTLLGEKVRRLLLSLSQVKIGKWAELFLYLAARAQLVEEILVPSLRKKKIVVLDRFTDSTIAYQGYGRALNKEIIVQLNSIVTGGINPDLTFLLTLPLEKSFQRLRKKKDRLESETRAFHHRVQKAYLKLAKSEPKRIKCISSQLPLKETTEIVTKSVIDLVEENV
jgi:dTMP kinase